MTMYYHRQLGQHYIAFLTTFSAVSSSLSTFWRSEKNSVIKPILKAGKPRDKGRSFRPMSMLSPAAKILERYFLILSQSSLGINFFLFVFNERMPDPPLLQQIDCHRGGQLGISTQSNTAFYSKCFTPLNSDTIWLNALWHTYHRGRNSTYLYQPHLSHFLQWRVGVPQGSAIYPTFFNFFVWE